jgi:hypothetical protein
MTIQERIAGKIEAKGGDAVDDGRKGPSWTGYCDGWRDALEECARIARETPDREPPVRKFAPGARVKDIGSLREGVVEMRDIGHTLVAFDDGDRIWIPDQFLDLVGDRR